MTPLDYLFGLEFHGIKLGLDNITTLLTAAGNPQHIYPTVHIGGTNGKGSTVAFLDHMLRECGYRVGRFTSPHLIALNERFMINGVSIGDSDLETLIETFRIHAEHADLTPTFFEMNTAIAFQFFADQQVDIALVEVGLGGRFDSTNVITPRVSVVTNIDLEHTQYLGDTYEAIAFEKAGIIKPGVPVIFGNLNAQAGPVLQRVAQEKDAPIFELGGAFTANPQSDPARFSYSGLSWRLDDLALPLLGGHQLENAAVALAAAELLAEHFLEVTPDRAASGLARTVWPCRMETVLESPKVIIDVAHNPAGAKTLSSLLHTPAILLLSVSTDKDAADMIAHLAPHANHVILTRFDGPRATDPALLQRHVPSTIPTTVQPDFNAAIEAGFALAAESDTPLLITGSLFTAGQARAYLLEHHNAAPLRF